MVDIVKGGGILMGLRHTKLANLQRWHHVTKRTVDYYTNIGLLKAERSASNYRFYNEEALKRLYLIEKLKS